MSDRVGLPCKLLMTDNNLACFLGKSNDKSEFSITHVNIQSMGSISRIKSMYSVGSNSHLRETQSKEASGIAQR